MLWTMLRATFSQRWRGDDLVMAQQQQIVLFRVAHGGVFGQKEAHNLPEINALLAQCWAGSAGVADQQSLGGRSNSHGFFALIVLEKD